MMHLNEKELANLLLIVQLDTRGYVELEHVRDEADVGWIDATIEVATQGSTRIRQRKFRLSPTGRINEDKHGYGTFEEAVL